MQSLDGVRGPVLDVTETICPISGLNAIPSRVTANFGKMELNCKNLTNAVKIYALEDR